MNGWTGCSSRRQSGSMSITNPSPESAARGGVGRGDQVWRERPAQPGRCDAPIMYVIADGTGVPMVAEERIGRRGKQAEGKAKTRQVYLGCVFTQHRVDEKGHLRQSHRMNPGGFPIRTQAG